MAESISSQRSRFCTGLFLGVFQPFFCQDLIHPCFKALTTSALSLWTFTQHGSVSAFNASMPARISTPQLAVFPALPLSSRSGSFHCNSAPHPPGPGLPLQAPSVHTIIFFLSDIFLSNGG